MTGVKNNSKNRVKKSKEKFLLLLLSCIESDGDNLKQILKKITDVPENHNIQKQHLNYHLQKLKRQGVIKRIQSYPFAIYELTEHGIRVKKMLTQSEGERLNAPLLWRCHNLIVGYPIISYGDFMFSEGRDRKIIHMNNWKYARETFGDFVINIQDTGLLKIYCPEKYTENPEEAFGKMYAEAQHIVQIYCNKYNMKLKKMNLIREGHKELQKSNRIAKVLGRFKADDIWTDASNGTLNMEEHQSSNKIEDLLNLPSQMNKWNSINEKFSKNLELHLEVLQEIRNAIKRLGK